MRIVLIKKGMQMTRPQPRGTTTSDRDSPDASTTDSVDGSVNRINSKDLFREKREVEIFHEGRIYRLRLTQLNKLILTA
jgi:hemin uptake protein HemP